MCLVSNVKKGCKAGLREDRTLVKMRMVGAGRLKEANHSSVTGLVVLGTAWISGG